jgi:hypothetical protein
MCEECRRELRAAYRGNPGTAGRIPPWEDDCGQEYCEDCGELFTPGDDDERRCPECERLRIANEDGEDE